MGVLDGWSPWHLCVSNVTPVEFSEPGVLLYLLPVVASTIPALAIHRQPINIEHITERYALFLLIVLGETITSLMADLPWRVTILSWPVFLGVLGGLAVSFSLKWLYFDVDEEKKIHPFRRTPWHGISWSLSHMPLSMAIAGTVDFLGSFLPPAVLNYCPFLLRSFSFSF